jgi:hypothetical protein
MRLNFVILRVQRPDGTAVISASGLLGEHRFSQNPKKIIPTTNFRISAGLE